jgi:hypothetical protein
MPPSPARSERVEILFCPFCGDGFEGRSDCPEHDLALLPLDELPRNAQRKLQRVTFFVDPRLGRGSVLLGISLALLGFLMPMLRYGELVESALEVAIEGAGNLWLAPGAALAVLLILWRRRSRSAMSGARGAVFGLALGGILPLLYTGRRIGMLAESFGKDLEWQWGFWLMIAGFVAAAVGSFRLGGPRLRRES